MLFPSTLASSVALLLAASQVSAHAFISPGLGVSGAGVRNDVQRPSTAKPCGTASLADLSTSTAAVATNGLFSAVVTNFNGGTDGSTQITSALVDTTGTGTSFTGKATIVKNGVLSPPAAGSANIQIQLPAGTTCTGAGGKCLVAMTTAGKFGNCVVVSTGAATGAATTAAGNTTTTSGTDSTGTTTTGTNSTVTDTTGTGNTTTTGTAATATKQKHHKGDKGNAGAGAGGATTAAAKAKAGAANAAVVKKPCEDDKNARRGLLFEVVEDREARRGARSLVANVKGNVRAARRWIWVN